MFLLDFHVSLSFLYLRDFRACLSQSIIDLFTRFVLNTIYDIDIFVPCIILFFFLFIGIFTILLSNIDIYDCHWKNIWPRGFLKSFKDFFSDLQYLDFDSVSNLPH